MGVKFEDGYGERGSTRANSSRDDGQYVCLHYLRSQVVCSGLDSVGRVVEEAGPQRMHVFLKYIEIGARVFL